MNKDTTTSFIRCDGNMKEHLVYEIWRDAMNGELYSVWIKTLDALCIPEECYGSTFTFVSVLLLVLYLVALRFPLSTINLVKYILNVEEPETNRTSEITIHLPFNDDSGRKRRKSSGDSCGDREQKEQKEENERKYKTQRTTKITNEYKKFAPSVLNIMGMQIKSIDKIEKIYDAIQEELSRESVIGYSWDKKIPKNIERVLDMSFPVGVKDDSE